MPFRRRLRFAALLAFFAAASSASPGRARAQEPAPTAGPPAPAPSSADVAAARVHFEHAREEYGKGSYREAVGELEAAHALDPTAKDLVFNLGVVHEKLSDIDDALSWFQLYTTMTLTPTERERADSYIRRLEGAKKELAAQAPAPPAPTTPVPARGAPASTRPAPDPTETAPHGRVDAATIAAASVAGAALVFGTALAVKAEDDRPINGYVTGRDGTLTDLQNRADLAHREAVIADIGFGASIAAGITAAVLYLARTRDAAKPAQASVHKVHTVHTAPPTVFAAMPLTGGGGALIVRGAL